MESERERWFTVVRNVIVFLGKQIPRVQKNTAKNIKIFVLL
jgi:hypothetical protein